MREGLRGHNAVQKALKSIVQGVEAKGKMRIRATGSAADHIRDTIKTFAPIGETGNLKHAVYARMVQGGNAQVGIDYGKAPHAHLVEYGTGVRRPKRGQVMRFTIDGRTVFVRDAGRMPRNPFFRRGTTVAEPRAIAMMKTILSEAISRAWNVT